MGFNGTEVSQKGENFDFLMLPEYHRRLAIIKELSGQVGYKKGDLVYPTDDNQKQKDGAFRIIAVCQDWNEFKGSEKFESRVKWPSNDNPFIVDAFSFKDKQIYNCTTNFFRLMTDEERTEFIKDQKGE